MHPTPQQDEIKYMKKRYKDMNTFEFNAAVGMDGKKWTEAFMEMHGDKMPDEGNILGWFCNAIMAGYDESVRRHVIKPLCADMELAPKHSTSKRKARLADEIYETLGKHGDWDDGCFYYNKHAASEFQSFIKEMRELNEAERQKAIGGAE